MSDTKNTKKPQPKKVKAVTPKLKEWKERNGEITPKSQPGTTFRGPLAPLEPTKKIMDRVKQLEESLKKKVDLEAKRQEKEKTKAQPLKLRKGEAHKLLVGNPSSVLENAVMAGVVSGHRVVLAPKVSLEETRRLNMQNAAAFARCLHAPATTVGVRIPDQFNVPSSTMAGKQQFRWPLFNETGFSGSTYTIPAGTYGYMKLIPGVTDTICFAIGHNLTTGAIAWGSPQPMTIRATVLASAWQARTVGVSSYLTSYGKPLEVEGQVIHGVVQGPSNSVLSSDGINNPFYLERDIFQTSRVPLGLDAEAFETNTFQACEYIQVDDSPWNYDIATVNHAGDSSVPVVVYKYYTVTANSPQQLHFTVDMRLEFIPFQDQKAIWEPIALPDAMSEVHECLAMVENRVYQSSDNRWIDRAVAAEELAQSHSVTSHRTSMSINVGGTLNEVNLANGLLNLDNLGKAYDVAAGALRAVDKVIQRGRRWYGMVQGINPLLMARHFQWVAEVMAGKTNEPSPLFRSQWNLNEPNVMRAVSKGKLNRKYLSSAPSFGLATPEEDQESFTEVKDDRDREVLVAVTIGTTVHTRSVSVGEHDRYKSIINSLPPDKQQKFAEDFVNGKINFD
jgi:hypothetical protein